MLLINNTAVARVLTTPERIEVQKAALKGLTEGKGIFHFHTEAS